jgi:hypothetical protein
MMALEDIRQTARTWLLELANCAWSEEQVAEMAHEAQSLKEEIGQGYEVLLLQRRRLERLQQRIEENEHKATALPHKVQSYLQVGNKKEAYQAALELDQVRAAVSADRSRRREMNQAYHQQAADLESERARLGKLQWQLMRLRPAARPA